MRVTHHTTEPGQAPPANALRIIGGILSGKLAEIPNWLNGFYVCVDEKMHLKTYHQYVIDRQNGVANFSRQWDA
jgi:hypothetical protein